MVLGTFLITLLAINHGYTVNKEWRQEVILSRLQKETSCVKVNLDGTMLKKFWFQPSAIMYNSSNHYFSALHRFQ